MARYRVERIGGLKKSEHRAVVLLSSEDDHDVDALKTFNRLDVQRERELRSRFETWIDGVHHNNRWFHGFDHADYRECFVFKWKEKRLGHRLYGFLWHPCPRTNKRLQICVLTNHAEKTGWETDLRELDKAKALRADAYVRAAIAMAFDDIPGNKRCLN